MKIKTNNIPRHLIYGYELTDKERQEFDYIPKDDMPNENFIRYKGTLYHTGDIMAIDTRKACLPYGFSEWHAYVSETFFSGVMFRFTEDHEQVICASYYS